MNRSTPLCRSASASNLPAKPPASPTMDTAESPSAPPPRPPPPPNLPGKPAGVPNEGSWGFPVRPDTTYTASFYAKSGGGFSGPVTASLVLDDGNVTVAKAEIPAITTRWQKYNA